MNNDTLERDTMRGTTMIDNWKEIEDTAEADESEVKETILKSITNEKLAARGIDTSDLELVGTISAFAFFSNLLYTPVKETFDDKDLARAIELGKEYKELMPYMQKLLKHDHFKSLNFNLFDILIALKSEFNGLKPNKAEAKTFIELVKLARKMRNGKTVKLDGETILPPLNLQLFASKETDKISVPHYDDNAEYEYPLDKINNNIWDMLFEADTDGQMTMTNFAVERHGSKQEVNVAFGISFDELEKNGITTTRELTPYDKRIYTSVNAIYQQGNKCMTLSQIYRAAGNNGRPGTHDLEKLNASLRKLGSIDIIVDNMGEVMAYKNRVKFSYEGKALPYRAVRMEANGKYADTIIELLIEPPLMTFARQRGQITTFKQQVLLSPISKTDAHLRIDDYLIERISANGLSNKILWETLFEETKNTTRVQKARAKEAVYSYLEHYKSVGFIADYSPKAPKDNGEYFTFKRKK